jgi:DNA-binding YbaB/EbfC family protein
MSKNPFSNMGALLKQAQAMQEKMGKIQEEAATKTVEAAAGGGMVTVQANGAMQITKLSIDPEVLKSGDHDMLQDLIVAASNEALRKAKELMAEEMKSLTGGMGLPGMF